MSKGTYLSADNPNQMANNRPFAPTDKEIKELTAVTELQDYWGGVDSVEEFEDMLKSVYIAKFDFMNDCPGYYGDLFLIQPGHLASEIPVVRVCRGKEGKLEILHERLI